MSAVRSKDIRTLNVCAPSTDNGTAYFVEIGRNTEQVVITLKKVPKVLISTKVLRQS